MKKLISLMLCAAVVLSMAACGQKNDAKTDNADIVTEIMETEQLPGGWSRPETTEVPDEVKEKLEKALEGVLVAEYTPVALLGTQVVAGMNYCILCQVTPIVPDAKSSWVLVYLYVDLNGDARITETVEVAEEAVGEDVEEENSMQIPNPFMDYATIEEAEAAVGFELTAPTTVEGFSEKRIQVMSGSMLQIIFLHGDDRLIIRKEAGSEDISGDYNDYAEIQTISVGDQPVTLKGNDGTVNVAIWTDGAYTYAVTADTPLTQEEMTALVAGVA